jgi:Tol biopolymer transport system component
MSALRLAVVTLLAVAAAGSTSVSATPRANPPLLTFVADGNLGLCATDLEGHTFRVSGPRLSGDLASWTPDGSLLSFVGGRRLFFLDAEGRVRRSLDWRTGNSSISSLVWSPDARRFAGVSAWGVYSWLWVMNADGTGHHTIVEGVGYGNLPRPAWSPDGSRILYSTSSGAYVVDPDGGDPEKLLDNATGAVWSPDGRRLAYVVLDQDGRSVGLGVAQADGSDAHTVVQGAILWPAWSPDGSTIAFTRAVGATSQVVLVDADGTNERTIASGIRASWAPDGSWIAFAQLDATYRSHAFVVRPDGTDQRLIESGMPGAFTFTFFWRPSAPFPQHRRRCVLSGAHVLKGTDRGDVLLGGTGPDRLYGRGGDDVLFGGPGHDRLYGGKGDDFIDAYDGMRDYLFGGPGSDRGSYDLTRDRRTSIEHYARPG